MGRSGAYRPTGQDRRAGARNRSACEAQDHNSSERPRAPAAGGKCVNTETANVPPLGDSPCYAGRCRWTPVWRDPYPRDSRGVCLCPQCTTRRKLQKRMKKKQFENIEDAYVARRYGKTQCDMSTDDWRIASVLKIKIRLERKLKSQ